MPARYVDHKLFRNDSGFPIFTGYLLINRTDALV